MTEEKVHEMKEDFFNQNNHFKHPDDRAKIKIPPHLVGLPRWGWSRKKQLYYHYNQDEYGGPQLGTFRWEYCTPDFEKQLKCEVRKKKGSGREYVIQVFRFESEKIGDIDHTVRWMDELDEEERQAVYNNM